MHKIISINPVKLLSEVTTENFYSQFCDISILASGSFGIVHRVTHCSTHQVFALKAIPFSREHRDGTREFLDFTIFNYFIESEMVPWIRNLIRKFLARLFGVSSL